MMLSTRSIFGLGFVFCSVMLAIAGYFQMVEQLEPCPLCILQRVLTLFVGVVLLIAILHNPKQLGMRIYGSIAGLFALIGAGISARHVWLQSLPEDQVPSCGPGLNFMLENFALNDTINMVLRGSGECAEVVWTFMGISIPGWTLLAFVLLFVATMSQVFRKSP
ncbi:MAG: disulfide bond formation protein B [Gammaproteobacteria bacterium]|nr:disulfide bond formation protein B [Gammaproteobacteria bacterium]